MTLVEMAIEILKIAFKALLAEGYSKEELIKMAGVEDARVDQAIQDAEENEKKLFAPK